MRARSEVSLLFVGALFLSASSVLAGGGGNPGTGDWGDAPEGAVAYPSLGVVGQFPTCFGGPSGFIWHGNPGVLADMFWGFNVDDEMDGNAGLCPPAVYELDECWGPFDGDGGLSTPDTYTISNGLVVPCGQTPPRALGTTCQVLNLTPGGPFDANLINNSGQPGFVNVLFDWNQDGRWGGFVNCGGPVPEHAIVNVPIPPIFSGPLSAIFPGPIQIGPNAGYVWVRLTISNQPVAIDWDGSGLFDLGETEDYLLRIDDGSAGEYGDAPEGVLAYPSGVIGQFPTCVTVGPASYVFHVGGGQAYFGPFVDYESDGNANTCPPPPYDQDECGAVPGGDAGLQIPAALTLTAGGTVTVCPGVAGVPNWTGCLTAKWGVDVDILATNLTPDDHYVNVLVDWDGDGEWTTATQVCPQGNVAQEQVLTDFVVPAGFTGLLSTLSPPDFTIGAPPGGLCWARFTISDTAVGAGWDGAGQFGDGETEDYLFRVARPPVGAPELGAVPMTGALRVDAVQPNPARDGASIRFTTARRGRASILLYDSAGRRVAVVQDRAVPAGTHDAAWDGRDGEGHRVTPGVYFVRARFEGEAVTVKLVVVR